MKILKFGGSSVGSPERIKKVIGIIRKSTKLNKSIAVVFSAFQGVTDQLISISRLAASGSSTYKEQLLSVKERHITAVRKLISAKNRKKVEEEVTKSCNELEDVLHGVYLVKELSPRTLDFIMSFGERLSSFIISEALKDWRISNEYLDSRGLVKTDESFGSARVLANETNKNIRRHFKHRKKTQIITGFIGSTVNGETTTLGRGGSDFSASIFGAALNAKEIEIWTDVDGVMTADPRKVKKAFSIGQMSYEEAMELSHFGAKVIHPPTMQPALDKNIPIRIRNTFNPAFKGTVIKFQSLENIFSIKGISSIDDISLLRVQGSGMVGVAGISQRIFGALALRKISVILITQASSEHSICFAVLPRAAASAKKAIEEELRLEIMDKQVSDIIVENNLSIIAVVGENMRNTTGIAGKVFQSFGRNGINIIAIAQGSSELNISAVVSKDDEEKALNAIHDSFFLSSQKPVNLFLVGTGLIGLALLKLLSKQYHYLLKEHRLQINLVGLANSKKMLIDRHGINLKNWKAKLEGSGQKSDLEKFSKSIRELNLPYSIFVDCTSSPEVVSRYPEILQTNISIVTPNKKANSGSYQFYVKLRELTLKHNVKFMYETNVGAGLPFINTLNDLVSSGDQVGKIEGILSGTLSYIFNSFKREKKFSEIVRQAYARGYTEPDPRDDLNGMDVARKLLILAREIGLKLELKDIRVENLIPASVRKAANVNDFFTLLGREDGLFEKKRRAAEEKGKVLRYIASLDGKRASVKLIEINKHHPFFSINQNDNVIAFYTKHSHGKPIIIKGPGAGAEITSSGVLADILRTANSWN